MALSLATITPALGAEASPAVVGSPAALAEEPLPMVATELPGAEALAAGHGRFVAVGTDGSFPQRPVTFTSADGMTWDGVSYVDAGPGSHMVAVTSTSDGFVALGYARDVDGAESNRILAWHSPDGTGWEQASLRRSMRRGLEAFPAGLADGPTGQLALGNFVGQDLGGQRLWHSVDGQSWEPTALPDVKRANWSTVVAVPDGYVLLGESGPRSGDVSEWKASNWHATDGVTWERLRGSPSLSDLAVATDGTAVGIGATEIWRSSDMVEWERVWSAPAEWALDGESAFEWVGWAGDRFLVTGRDYGACAPQMDECVRFPLLESADGRTWSQVHGPDGSIGIDSDTWLVDVASDGVSTVVLSIESGGSPLAWLMEPVPADTTGIE